MSTPAVLASWAARHRITSAALADLLQVMEIGSIPTEPAAPPPPAATEAYAQSLVRLEAPRFGVSLWRNNVGARTITEDDGTRRHIRWGLANESPAMNKVLKSGDLIGVRPIVITPAHVGATIGQFVSRECKRPGWTWRGDEHETAQLNWAMLVTRLGGDAQFATGEGSFK